MNTAFYELAITDHFGSHIQCYPHFNILFILEGHASVLFYKESWAVKKNDIIYFKPYEIHQIVNASQNFKAVIFLIHNTLLDTVHLDLTKVHFSPHHLTADTAGEAYHSICYDLAQVLYYNLKNDDFNELLILKHLTSVLTSIFRFYGSKTVPIQSREDPDRIYQAIIYISKNYTRTLTMPEVARHLNIHPQYFSTWFKKNMRESFSEYLGCLRVVSTFPQLIHTNQSLIDIAFASGFNNYKTYSTAFKKHTGMSPKEYRRTQAVSFSPFEAVNISNDHASIFAFFQQYWNQDRPEAPAAQSQIPDFKQHISLDFNASVFNPHLFCGHMPKICYSIGRAADLLRHDTQEQIRRARKELGITVLRFRDIFSDMLFVYYETPDKTAIYNWQYIDMIYDFLINLDISPFTEIGFMPRLLASKQQFAGWQHRPNVSFPRSLKNWSRLVTGFISHLAERYGISKVRTWIFNIWTNPDLNLKNGYWYETMDNFFLFYRVTYNAIKSVDESIPVSTPDFTLPFGMKWYEAFFNYCTQYELYPSYLSVHLYAENPTEEDFQDSLKHYSAISRHPSGFYPGQRLYQSFFDLIHTVSGYDYFRDLPIVIPDWNITYTSINYNRDTCFMAAFIAYTLRLLCTQNIALLSFSSFSDINEDFFPDEIPFGGGPGLLDIHGFKKASYNTFFLSSRLGTQVLSQNRYHLLSKTPDGYSLLLFHMVYDELEHPPVRNDRSSYYNRYDWTLRPQNLMLHMMMDIGPGLWEIQKFEVSRNHGSAYDLWIQMGAPQKLTSEICDYIKALSVPALNIWQETVEERLVFNVELTQHSVVLIELKHI